MIIPIGLNHVIRGWPWVTIALILTCTLVQAYEDSFAPSAEQVQAYVQDKVATMPPDADAATDLQVADDIERYALRVPSLRFGYPTDGGVSYRLVTSAFVHVGWWHLIGNMLFLWLAGAALEDRWGRARFTAFYLAGAVISALGFASLHHGAAVLLVGASGAVAALMGAFLVCFARMQIHFVYWFGHSVGRFDAVAYVVLPLWLAVQVLYAWIADERGTSSVAFSAHIVGFAFGAAVALVAKYRERAAERADTQDAEPPRAIARPAPAGPRPIGPPRPVTPPPRPVAPPTPEPVDPVAPADAGKEPRFLA